MKDQEEAITYLAIRLRRNMLSADELQRELGALTRGQRIALVDCLDRMEKGPVEVFASASGSRTSRL